MGLSRRQRSGCAPYRQCNGLGLGAAACHDGAEWGGLGSPCFLLLGVGGGFLRGWGRQQLPFPSVGDLQMDGCNAASSAAPCLCPPSGSAAVDLRLVPPLEPQQHPSLQDPSSQSGAIGSYSLSEPGVQQGKQDLPCWLQEVEPGPIAQGWFAVSGRTDGAY